MGYVRKRTSYFSYTGRVWVHNLLFKQSSVDWVLYWWKCYLYCNTISDELVQDILESYFWHQFVIYKMTLKPRLLKNVWFWFIFEHFVERRVKRLNPKSFQIRHDAELFFPQSTRIFLFTPLRRKLTPTAMNSVLALSRIDSCILLRRKNVKQWHNALTFSQKRRTKLHAAGEM